MILRGMQLRDAVDEGGKQLVEGGVRLGAAEIGQQQMGVAAARAAARGDQIARVGAVVGVEEGRALERREVTDLENGRDVKIGRASCRERVCSTV